MIVDWAAAVFSRLTVALTAVPTTRSYSALKELSVARCTTAETPALVRTDARERKRTLDGLVVGAGRSNVVHDGDLERVGAEAGPEVGLELGETGV